MLQRHVAGFYRKICDWIAGGCDLENLRFQNTVRQIATDLIDRIFNFADCGVDIVADFELGADGGVALIGAGVDIAHTLHTADGGFDFLRYLRRDFSWGGTRLRN